MPSTERIQRKGGAATEEKEEVLAGSRTVNSTRSCLPEWWAEHHVNTCRPGLPPSKPDVGSFLRWDTYPGHSRLVPRLFIWLRDEERHWRKELLSQSRSGLVHACRMKTFQTILKMHGSRGRQGAGAGSGLDHPAVILRISRRSCHRRCLLSPSRPVHFVSDHLGISIRARHVTAAQCRDHRNDDV